MEDKFTKIECSFCKKEFLYQIFDMRVPGDKDREYIYCPYCMNANGSLVTSGWILSYKLEEKQND